MGPTADVMRVVELLRGDDAATDVICKLVTLLADRREPKKNRRR